MTDFAAIDFETANEQPCSVCSVGVVIVRGGEVVDSFYSLIHPEPEYYQWFCQRVHGLSAPRFAVESKRRTRRGLQYEKAIFPKQSYGLGVVRPDGVGKLVFTFDKIALTRGQVFRVYFYEKGGARNFVLTLSAGDVNGARRLN